MPLPPKGDPQRPLHLAIRSMRSLGTIMLLFGCLTVLPALIVGRRVGFRFGPFFVHMIVCAMVYLLPGAAFIVFSIAIRRRQFWAVVASIALASTIALLMLIGILATTIGLISTWNDDQTFRVVVLILVGIMLIIFIALAKLVDLLVKSFEAIKHGPPEEERGFEPILAQNASAAAAPDAQRP